MGLEEPTDKKDDRNLAKKRELARLKKETNAIIRLDHALDEISEISDDELIKKHEALFDDLAKKTDGKKLALLLEMERELTSREGK